MAVVNPYLNFNGQCEAAFNFYKSVFGGEFMMISRFKEVPPEYTLPASEAESIMHVALPIGKGSVLMGSDIPESYGKGTPGTLYNIAINTDSEQEATDLFNGLSAGGKITMPLAKAFWGAYFGMFVDKFDVQWMVSYDENNH
ncbi:VOC family protein [Chitinophaga sp. MM2321]|uniref:VOC family protein n=1 Tax=Chitinophaga sp. MM2321 TaxID=3137178 RepID=UPI0032D5692D